jgi:TolA-binding protein
MYGTRMRMSVMLFLAGCASASPSEAPKPEASTPQPEAAQEPKPTAADCKEHEGALDKASPQHTAENLLAAAACYRKGSAVAREIVVLHALIASFPDHPRAKEAVRDAGQAYEGIGHTADAARMFEEYARRYAAEPDAADLLKRATCFRHGFGDDRTAEQNLQELRRRHRVTATLDELCPKPAP